MVMLVYQRVHMQQRSLSETAVIIPSIGLKVQETQYPLVMTNIAMENPL